MTDPKSPPSLDSIVAQLDLYSVAKTPEAREEHRPTAAAVSLDPRYRWDDIVPARGHHCFRERIGERCAGPGQCPDLDRPTPPPGSCEKGGEYDGFRCGTCGQWNETVLRIAHRNPRCVPLKVPAKARRGGAR